MNTNADFDRHAAAWLADGPAELSDRVLDAALREVRVTHQRRALRVPWRFPLMPALNRVTGIAAVALVAAVGAGLIYRNAAGPGGPGAQSPSVPTAPASASNGPSQSPAPTSRTVTIAPWVEPGIDPRDDTILMTFDVPPSWELWGEDGAFVDDNGPPFGAGVLFFRPTGLFSDPCLPETDTVPTDISVGPSVEDLVTALVDHPSLDVTAPVDVTLAGYSGKYLDLEVPADISECGRYQPLDAHIYAQGPSHRWHMWVLDVGGVRVLVESSDYATTPARRLAEQQAILDSLEITP